MNYLYLSAAIMPLLMAAPAMAEEAPAATPPAATAQAAPADTPVRTAPKAFSTGVAKGRDLLDSAISASTLDEVDLPKVGTSSVAGIIGNLPGIRAETSGIDGVSSLTVRGLPLAADGSKYLQIQEDGLPVLEFGDIHFGSTDMFLRADMGLSQVQVIRGGSASTFASNSPGGLINFISKTGEEEGGAVMVTSGLDYDLNRVDFDYGAPLGDGWRFHVGGFYREGEGPRDIGYDGFKGGQFKANLTRQLDHGYIRFYAKYLDDRQPNYGLFPLVASGSNSDPSFGSLPGTDGLRDTMLSNDTAIYNGVDQNNNPTTFDRRNGVHGVVKSVGAEGQYDINGWTISEKLRYSRISGEFNDDISLVTMPAATLMAAFAGPGSRLSYATGPNAGQVIANPATLNGNGQLQIGVYANMDLNSLDNVTNDLRASKVWNVGEGKLTTTFGLYASSQDVDMYWSFANALEGYASGGQAVRYNLTTATNIPVTDNGMLAYGFATAAALYTYHQRYDVNYQTLAPYASANYQIGKLAVGASIRLDHGDVSGNLYGASLGGSRVGQATVDVNGNGSISLPETKVAVLPLTQPGTVDYGYDYVSYSVGVNYRIAEPVSVFGRYSRGGRAAAERQLFSPTQFNSTTGQLVDSDTAYGEVQQAEAGVKFRQEGLTAYATAFWASTGETNSQIGADSSGAPKVISFTRDYSATGIELESEYSHGPFSVAVGATYAKASIDSDSANAALVGNRPRHAPELFYNVRPQWEQGMFTVGATINGTTSSYAQDDNVLVQPGYVIVNPYVYVRPVRNVELGVTAFNVFDEIAIVNIGASAIPASGVVQAQTLNGRTISASLRYTF
jgi:outer membrane receptor protein involved in Fe transport